jgi:hypothetical protein
MNILSELLPGARQIRTPLAVGYLWLFVGWINIVHLPAHFRNSALAIRATTDLGQLTPILAVVIVSFAAYLIGIFFELFDSFLMKIAAGVAGAALALACLIFLLIVIIGIWPVTLIFVGIASFVFIFKARRYKTAISIELRQWLINVYLPIQGSFYALKTQIVRVWSPASPVRNDMTSDEAVKLLDNNPQVMLRFCKAISVLTLRLACLEAGVDVRRANSFMTTSDGEAIKMAKVAARSWADKHSESLLRDYLLNRMEASREVRRAVILRVMDTSDIHKLVYRALGDAASRVQADKPGIFEVCDRLRSEGELRRGLAIPLGVALSSICAIYTSNVWMIVTAAVPTIFIYFSGMRKDEEAAKVIVSCVSAEIVHIQLSVNDARLLKWPTPSVPEESRAATWIRMRIAEWRKTRLRSSDDVGPVSSDLDT